MQTVAEEKRKAYRCVCWTALPVDAAILKVRLLKIVLKTFLITWMVGKVFQDARNMRKILVCGERKGRNLG